MAEEIQDNNTPAAPEYSPTEKQAMEQGWVPKDQWSGEGKWRDAESFLDRGELFGKIDTLNRKYKNTEAALVALQGHYAKVQETEYKRALEDLRKQKKEAIVDNDPDEIVRIDEEMLNLKAAQAQPTPQVHVPQPNPVFEQWLSRNQWYNSDPAKRKFADELGNQMAGSGKSAFEVLMDVSDAVSKKFASNPNREKPGAVEGGSAPGGKGNSHVELSEVEAQVMKKLVGTGVLTKEQYISDIRKQREKQ